VTPRCPRCRGLCVPRAFSGFLSKWKVMVRVLGGEVQKLYGSVGIFPGFR